MEERSRIDQPPPQNGAEAWLEPALRALEFGCGSSYAFENGDEFDKRMVVSTIGGSNLLFSDRRVRFEPVGLFGVIAKAKELSSWGHFAEDIRTFFMSEEGQAFVTPILKCTSEVNPS